MTQAIDSGEESVFGAEHSDAQPGCGTKPPRRIEIQPGTRFGRLTVLSTVKQAERPHYRVYCVCRCDCGRLSTTRADALRASKTFSCGRSGCYRGEVSAIKRTKHGLSYHPLYSLWSEMLRRCENPKAQNYRMYGGRGIAVCERWHTFAHFLEDMPPRPSRAYTLDRVNNDLGYQSGNCAWKTAVEQSRNTRIAIRVIVYGQEHSLNSARKIFGLTSAAPITRLMAKNGLNAQQAVDHFAATLSQRMAA
jgi:hypothetical protein